MSSKITYFFIPFNFVCDDLDIYERVLYGFLATEITKFKKCEFSNSYISKNVFGCNSNSMVKKAKNGLRDKGYISWEVVRDKDNNTISRFSLVRRPKKNEEGGRTCGVLPVGPETTGGRTCDDLGGRTCDDHNKDNNNKDYKEGDVGVFDVMAKANEDFYFNLRKKNKNQYSN